MLEPITSKDIDDMLQALESAGMNPDGEAIMYCAAENLGIEYDDLYAILAEDAD